MTYAIKKLRERMFPGRGGATRAAGEFGVSAAVWSHYERAAGLQNRTLERLAKFFNVKVADLIESPEEPAANALDRLAAPPGSRRMAVRNPGKREWWEKEEQDWTVRGAGAADDSSGTRVPGHDDFDDPENPPEGMTLVPVVGDSMRPLLLPGQYAMIDKNREGFENDGGIVVIVVARDETVYETYIKRCFREGGRYVLESINDYDDIVLPVSRCHRIWPVIGVWFAGKGKSPGRKKRRSPAES